MRRAMTNSIWARTVNAGAGRRMTSFSNCENVPRETVDAVVIGAGVVGIAVARELSVRGRDVIVIESAPTFGSGTSSRNSEVVHAGIYYPLNSLKAKFCVRGRELMYGYCSERGIPHNKLGKLIVATGTAQISNLEQLKRRGEENGVEGLKMLDGAEAMSMEPELLCVKALFSPCSGIVDSHSLMISLLGEAESHRTTVSFNSTIIGGHVEEGKLHLHMSETENISTGESSSLIRPQLVVIPKLIINAAGLGAISLAKRFHGINHRFVPPCYFARGCYFTMSGTKSPFRHLIYPVPEDGGLGVHVTLDLGGAVKFGPDVEWIDSPDDASILSNRFDYSVDPDRSARFYSEIRKYYPNLKDRSLEPGYAGIRVKLSGPGNPPSDFLIQGEETHGLPGLVNCFGIESPGLTSSLAIAEYIVSKYSR